MTVSNSNWSFMLIKAHNLAAAAHRTKLRHTFRQNKRDICVEALL